MCRYGCAPCNEIRAGSLDRENGWANCYRACRASGVSSKYQGLLSCTGLYGSQGTPRCRDNGEEK